jgi:hypothetical protein
VGLCFAAAVLVAVFVVVFAVDAVLMAVAVATDTSAVGNVGCTFTAGVVMLVVSFAATNVVAVYVCCLWCRCCSCQF